MITLLRSCLLSVTDILSISSCYREISYYCCVFSTASTTRMDASCLWLFKSSVNNSVLSDEVSGRNIHLEGGALITNTTERGLVVDTNGGWISLKETNGKFRRNDVNNCNKRVNSIKEKVYLSQLNHCEGRRKIYCRRPFLLLIV